MLTATELEDRLDALWGRITRAGGSKETVSLCAVTKTFPVEVCQLAAAAGVVLLGENYAEELCAKAAVVGAPGITWSYLGAIQRKKLAKLAPVVGLYQSVTRLEEATDIARRSPGARILLQVDTTALPQRNGVEPRQLEALCGAVAPLDVDLEGLMVVAPNDPAGARQCFEEVAALGRSLGLRSLSMGMSGDLEAAIEAGSTMVRVGQALFGSR